MLKRFPPYSGIMASTSVTLAPSLTSRMARFEPMKPRPPVINTRAPAKERCSCGFGIDQLLHRIVDRTCHRVDLFVGESDKEWQRKDLCRRLFCHWEATAVIAQVAVRGLQMHRDRIMDLRIDSATAESVAECVAAAMADDV